MLAETTRQAWLGHPNLVEVTSQYGRPEEVAGIVQAAIDDRL